MSGGRHELRGELTFSFEAAAECYRVEVAWIERVVAAGVLGPGERTGERVALVATDLDRLARILRWHRHHGLDLETVLALLDG